MTATDPHPELVGHPAEERLRAMLDVFHRGDLYESREPPAERCTCEWGQNSTANDAVAILDGHDECPFCRGLNGGEQTDD